MCRIDVEPFEYWLASLDELARKDERIANFHCLVAYRTDKLRNGEKFREGRDYALKDRVIEGGIVLEYISDINCGTLDFSE